jgi:putative redox protein
LSASDSSGFVPGAAGTQIPRFAREDNFLVCSGKPRSRRSPRQSKLTHYEKRVLNQPSTSTNINNPQSKTDNSSEEGLVNNAKATWIAQQRYTGIADSGHSITVDGDKAAGNSPMELVLIGLCGCTGYDVVSILQKKREPLTSLEVRAEAERAPHPPAVYTSIRLIYRVGGTVSRKAVEDAVRLSEEKYCSVSAMLSKTAKITTAIEFADQF